MSDFTDRLIDGPSRPFRKRPKPPKCDQHWCTNSVSPHGSETTCFKCKRILPKVDSIYRDDDGWWCILKDGWTIDGCVGWREDKIAKLVRRIAFESKQTGLT